MTDKHLDWDFFLAHPSNELETARDLYDRLQGKARVFLDAECIELGDDWDLALVRAQKSSLISVILVSAEAEESYYVREEIRSAIEMGRSKSERHVVVPLYLDQAAMRAAGNLYGLKLKQGLVISDELDLDEVTERLLQLLARLRADKEWKPVHPSVVHRHLTRKHRFRALDWAMLAITVVAVVAAIMIWAPGMEPAVSLPPLSETTPLTAAAIAPELHERERDCVKIEALSPNVIPHYLLNSIGHENFPYWLRLTAVNDCGNPKRLKVRFDDAENVEMDVHSLSLRLPSDGKPVEQTFKPEFRLLTKEMLYPVKIHWSVEDEKQAQVKVGSIITEIVPPYTVAWDLRRPAGEKRDGEPVEKEYLVASLAAWTIRPPKEVAELGWQCRSPNGAGVPLRKDDAIGSCYRDLFGEGGKVRVFEDAVRFPDMPRQYIAPPSQVLQRGNANSLEAALLLIAVVDSHSIEGVDPVLVLLASPLSDTADGSQKAIYAAWQEPGDAWRAVDLRYANSRSFEENVRTSSVQVGSIMQEHGKVIEGLGVVGSGISGDGRVFAVSPGKISPEYRIHKLP
ncbi:MAG: toll/interleukin-1 receptor domain-containing protein [Gammaproteobacteria bacterium]|nr:toll/interleukin-1 receptor domain-containing protein [Gammaproteobacteria bacterium]